MIPLSIHAKKVKYQSWATIPVSQIDIQRNNMVDFVMEGHIL
jgi:hypothetical protein